MPEFTRAGVYPEIIPSDVHRIARRTDIIMAVAGITERGPLEVREVADFSEFKIIFGGHIANSYVSYSIEDYFKKIKGLVKVKRIVHLTDITDPATKTSVAAFKMLQDGSVDLPGTTTGTNSENFDIAAATAGSTTGTEVERFDIGATNNALKIKVDGGSSMDVILTTDALKTAQEVADEINAGTTGLTASATAAKKVKIESNTTGSTSLIELETVASDAYTDLGLTVDIYTGTDTPSLSIKVDAGASQPIALTAGIRTANQIVADINAVVTGAAASKVGGKVKITSDTTGASSTIEIEAAVANAILGFTVGTYTGADASQQDTLLVTALSDGTWGDSVQVQIAESSIDPDSEFKIIVIEDSIVRESFDNLNFTATSERYAETKINGKSNYIVVEDQLSSSTPPLNRPVQGTESLTGGDDGLIGLSDTDYIGSSAGKTGLYAFDSEPDISTLIVPGITTLAVHNGMITYAETRDFIEVILDPPVGYDRTAIKTYVTDTAAFNSKKAVIYWPSPYMLDSLTRQKALRPPSGQTGGIWARTDVRRGTHKAPAGTEDGRLSDILGLEFRDNETDQRILYPVKINPIVKHPQAGYVLWGNRTLSADIRWEALNVVRLFHSVTRDLVYGTQWAVFEPNNQDLWEALRDSIRLYLLGRWRDGAFFDGGTDNPDDAFYVKCDETLNTQSVVEAKRVIVEIGICPTQAAEFVHLRITQWDGGRLIEELAAA